MNFNENTPTGTNASSDTEIEPLAEASRVAAAICVFVSRVLIVNGRSFEYFRLCFPVSNRRIFTAVRTSFKSALMAAL